MLSSGATPPVLTPPVLTPPGSAIRSSGAATILLSDGRSIDVIERNLACCIEVKTISSLTAALDPGDGRCLERCSTGGGRKIELE